MQSAASKPVNKRRGLKESCKTMSPSSPDTTPSNLVPREQWMKEDDPRTEEQADADWRLVTESIFGANTGAAPKVVEEKDWCDEKFRPNWGSHVTQELRDEEKRCAEEWSTKVRADERRTIDKQREGGGSPLRGDRNLKSTLLDEIEDPHGDYIRARATGYENPLVSPGWEDVGRHDDEVKDLLSAYTHPERSSSSSAPDQNRSSR